MGKNWRSKNLREFKTKIIRVVINRGLSFNEYVSSFCKKAGRKLSVLSRLSNLMSLQQRRPLMKSLVEAQFGYCPLVWMFHDEEINRKISHIHERSPRIVYRDYYLRRIILSVFTIETSRAWPLNYST